ncbi:hypothetical protein OG994_26065 [Micromonospora globbae]|uniref:Uncharacterized protein n=1 Tax=Micromonospora globbae TaxID=1894969 RepID=A0ABZ1S3H8_9ACTN|nr:hypothetical protein [Micromonospora globbae]
MAAIPEAIAEIPSLALTLVRIRQIMRAGTTGPGGDNNPHRSMLGL